MMKGSANTFRQQTGVMLLEVLIAILIFSLGILAIVGLQATSIIQANDAMFRTQASLLANELIGQMGSTVDLTQSNPLSTFASPSGSAYTPWLAKVQTSLPGVTDSVNLPSVNIAANGTVTIDIFWKMPSEQIDIPAHHHVSVARIPQIQ
jgi:type IV pilus assembly protein PilV